MLIWRFIASKICRRSDRNPSLSAMLSQRLQLPQRESPRALLHVSSALGPRLIDYSPQENSLVRCTLYRVAS